MTSEEEVYTKLFRALEEGRTKQEDEILDHLRDHFGLQPSEVTSSGLRARGVPAVEVFAEVVRQLGPFARMLTEIYSFLAGYSATAAGGADTFAFRFEELDCRVDFPLDSFPKTWAAVAGGVVLGAGSLDPDAAADLLVDVPDYVDEWNALDNLGNHLLFREVEALERIKDGDPRARDLLARHPGLRDELRADAATLLMAADRTLIHRAITGDSYVSPVVRHRYFRDEAAIGERFRAMRDARRAFDLTGVHEFLAGRIGGGSYLVGQDPRLMELWVSLYRRAVAVALGGEGDPVEAMSSVVDEVVIPFWRHRWRLYEVWALVFTLSRAPRGVEAELALEPRPGDPTACDWPIPHGKARAPVGRFGQPGAGLEVWFQRMTRGSRRAIEPDIRVMTGDGSDVLVLELKDRHHGPGGHARRVAERYADETGAPLVVVANYSPFRGSFASGGPERWHRGSSEILVAESLAPRSIPADVLDEIEGVLARALPDAWDLMVDVSASMDADRVGRIVSKLIDERGFPRSCWTFATHARRLEGDPRFELPAVGGGTRAAEALDRYVEEEDPAGVSGLVVVTDDDGARQLAARDPAGPEIELVTLT